MTDTIQDRNTEVSLAKLNLDQEYIISQPQQHLKSAVPLAGGAGTFLGTGSFTSGMGFLGISGTLKTFYVKNVIHQ